MTSRMTSMWKAGVVAMGAFGIFLAPISAQAVKPELKGKFEILKDEPSTHQPGKVKIVEF